MTAPSALLGVNPLRRHLRTLCAGELVNVPLQAALWFGLVQVPATPANPCGYGLFSLLLLQGAGYYGLTCFLAGQAVCPRPIRR